LENASNAVPASSQASLRLSSHSLVGGLASELFVQALSSNCATTTPASCRRSKKRWSGCPQIVVTIHATIPPTNPDRMPKPLFVAHIVVISYRATPSQRTQIARHVAELSQHGRVMEIASSGITRAAERDRTCMAQRPCARSIAAAELGHSIGSPTTVPSATSNDKATKYVIPAMTTYSIIPILAITRHGFKLATCIAVRDGGL
jgi:hypothetical protein